MKPAATNSLGFDLAARETALVVRTRRDAIAVRDAAIGAVVETVNEVQRRIRSYIDAHFTGSMLTSNNHRRVGNAVAQRKFYDEVAEKGQFAGLNYSKWGSDKGGKFVDFLLLHMRGGTIRPGPGEDWLRLANPGAGGTARIAAQTGRHAAGSEIFFVEAPGGQKLFQLRRRGRGKGASTELLATLVKSVTIPASATGVDDIAEQRPALFQQHFDALLARNLQVQEELR